MKRFGTTTTSARVAKKAKSKPAEQQLTDESAGSPTKIRTPRTMDEKLYVVEKAFIYGKNWQKILQEAIQNSHLFEDLNPIQPKPSIKF